MSENNTPVQRFKAGAVSATVWTNDRITKSGEPAAYFSISLDRAYKDKEGEWKHVNSFRVNDLPKASLVLQKAYEWLALNVASE